jgi:hypothetical protein
VKPRSTRRRQRREDATHPGPPNSLRNGSLVFESGFPALPELEALDPDYRWTRRPTRCPAPARYPQPERNEGNPSLPGPCAQRLA